MKLFDRINQNSEEVEIKSDKASTDDGKLKEDVETRLGSVSNQENTSTGVDEAEISELKDQNEEILNKLDRILDELNEDDSEGGMNGVL